jgi:hypothetical protein
VNDETVRALDALATDEDPLAALRAREYRRMVEEAGRDEEEPCSN